MPGDHARLSASGAHRWMACPGSVRLEQGFPESTSTYAEEGTLAHSMAELILRYNNGELTKRTFSGRMNKLREHELYSKEMEDYIADYTSRVWEEVNDAKRICPDAQVLFEQRLDFSAYVPEGFGTGDVVIVAEPELRVIDLKYGQGVPVSAVENPQLKLYGLGALEEYGGLYDIQKVVTTIIQPRLDSVSSHEYTPEELECWGTDTVAPRAAEALGENAALCAGGHCRFCKAKAVCRARAEENLELAKYEFSDPDLLSDEEIAEILKQAEDLAAWAKDIQEFALEEALKGKKWDGWKLVEGRSNRKYTDKTVVASVLTGAGYVQEQIFKPAELLGITDMTKLVGKKRFEELLGSLIEKPEGKPTLVPSADKRPEWNKAADDFADDQKTDICVKRMRIGPMKPLEEWHGILDAIYGADVVEKAYEIRKGELENEH